jgi:tetratricopeptide (TPR) repeat protein
MAVMSPVPSLLQDSAVANLLEELRAEPSSPALLLAVARALNARSMPEEASRHAERLISLEPGNGEAWYEAIIARSLAGPEALEDILGRCEELVSRLPRAAWAWRNLGLMAYYLERDDEAQRCLARALEADPEDPHAEEVHAYLAYTVGDLDRAVEHGIKAVERDARNYRALHWLGECYARLDAPDQAVRYFVRALRIEEGFFFALESLGAIYLRDESTHARGLQCFLRILAVNPCYFPAWFQLADAYIRHERFTEAAAQAESVLHLGPDATARADAHQYLGLIALMTGRDDAHAHFEQALAVDPKSAAAHHYLGVIAEQRGDLEHAEACYRRAMALDGEYALPLVRLGYLCFDRKEFESARRHFDAALRIDDDDYLAHLGLSEIARWRKDHDEQLARCLRAAELAPADSNVSNQLGTAHDALGQPREAVAAYEQALALDPRNRHAANNLGYLLERLLRSAPEDEGRDLRRRAVAAWKQRLLACRDLRVSVKGARSHLEKLGVPASQVDAWLREEPPVPAG